MNRRIFPQITQIAPIEKTVAANLASFKKSYRLLSMLDVKFGNIFLPGLFSVLAEFLHSGI